MGLAKTRMAIEKDIKEEQDIFNAPKSKRKISTIKKQAQFAGISNTGKGTIQIPDKKTTVQENISKGLFDDWDDDLEAFE